MNLRLIISMAVATTSLAIGLILLYDITR